MQRWMTNNDPDQMQLFVGTTWVGEEWNRMIEKRKRKEKTQTIGQLGGLSDGK